VQSTCGACGPKPPVAPVVMLEPASSMIKSASEAPFELMKRLVMGTDGAMYTTMLVVGIAVPIAWFGPPVQLMTMSPANSE